MAARIVVSLDDRIQDEAALAKAITVVGRHPDCDIVIEHPAVSGRHMLLRVVNTTVYAEDLASTNGMRVNGLTAHHQVIHHLDVIEVGVHKLHFFDDSLLTGALGGLESTVHTDFERTAMGDAPPPPPARRADELDATQAIPRAATVVLGPSQETVRTGAPSAGALALRIAAGAGEGSWVALDKANTMIGDPATETALVVRRGEAYYLARFSGHAVPRLNGRDLGPGTHRISPGDAIDVGGSRFEVVQGR